MTYKPLQLWGGVECTCNRVGDKFYDQMNWSGHATRAGDLCQFARLGLQTLRVGLLWERHALDPSWTWADERLGTMKRLGIRPIVGLLHHGSGPPHTSLLDPNFPVKLAEYAGQVAERYPWVTAYTPVNEPNTTARFSGYYGLWYPHHRSRQSYINALINQLQGTVLSMEAIRRVQPGAQLIQTEDIGKIGSTPELRRDRDLLNHRRWITYDLLCGEVDRDHPLYRYLRRGGATEEQILWFLDHPCPPDVVGINYYVTSDRFLDHRFEYYPADRGSIEGPFIDVDAARVDGEQIAGFESMVLEAWQRYHLPVAITEVHLGDCAAEQIRWLAEAWNGALRARQAGAECVAVTVWALLGSFDWDVLVTRANGNYEPGVFDVVVDVISDLANDVPKPTELAEFVRALAGAGEASPQCPDHPALVDPGWWRAEDRVAFRPPCAQLDRQTTPDNIDADLLGRDIAEGVR